MQIFDNPKLHGRVLFQQIDAGVIICFSMLSVLIIGCHLPVISTMWVEVDVSFDQRLKKKLNHD